MTDAFGPIRFRIPLDAADRAALAAPDAVAGDVIAGWPAEALAITASWPAALPNAPTVRPVFPGTLQFLATDITQIPTEDQIDAVNGRVTDACLDRYNLLGNLLVRVQGANQRKAMIKDATLGPLAEAPTFAAYGPIKVSTAFLRSAVLDHRAGLGASWLWRGTQRINPGDHDWQMVALLEFLAGRYQPVLRAANELDADDAGRLPMPELVVANDRSVALGVGFGWTRTPSKPPAGLGDTDVEVVPAVPFMRHVGLLVREPVRGAGVDALTAAIFENEDTSKPWADRLADKLFTMGFGDLARTMPLEDVLREFQIAAAGPLAAVPAARAPNDPQLALRDFHDLTAGPNQFKYAGPISGRANHSTRVCIEGWATNGLRSPVIIVAYDRTQLDASERPPAGTAPRHADLWKREETQDNRLRMFAANIARVNPGTPMGEADLELIGYCSPYTRSDPANPGQTITVHGPGTLKPNRQRRVADAEVTPLRLLNMSESDLLNPLPPNDPVGLARLSTFKVVRALAEQECLGYLDQINAYDDAGISFGPCHWSMARAIGNPTGTTELGGFAAFLNYIAADHHIPGVEAFLAQGLKAVSRSWETPRVTAQRTSEAAYRNQLGFIDDRGAARDMTSAGPRDAVPSWRSFYRWVEIGRRNADIGPPAWMMTIRRLHALLAVPISLVHPPVDHRQTAGSAPTIGSVFTSEVAIAQILRWHVKITSAVVVGSGEQARAHSRIGRAYADALPADPSDWMAWEANLIRTLRDQLDAFIAATGTAHDELDDQFDDIAAASWINATDPPTVGHNDRAYGLDPRLRVLSAAPRSFRLAPVGP